MAYKHKTVTYVVCDCCGKSTRLGESLNWDNQMNGALSEGYTFKDFDGSGRFMNYCRDCRRNYEEATE